MIMACMWSAAHQHPAPCALRPTLRGQPSTRTGLACSVSQTHSSLPLLPLLLPPLALLVPRHLLRGAAGCRRLVFMLCSTRGAHGTSCTSNHMRWQCQHALACRGVSQGFDCHYTLPPPRHTRPTIGHPSMHSVHAAGAPKQANLTPQRTPSAVSTAVLHVQPGHAHGSPTTITRSQNGAHSPRAVVNASQRSVTR
jgi:hypothetical protein